MKKLKPYWHNLLIIIIFLLNHGLNIVHKFGSITFRSTGTGRIVAILKFSY